MRVDGFRGVPVSLASWRQRLEGELSAGVVVAPDVRVRALGAAPVEAADADAAAYRALQAAVRAAREGTRGVDPAAAMMPGLPNAPAAPAPFGLSLEEWRGRAPTWRWNPRLDSVTLAAIYARMAGDATTAGTRLDDFV